MKALVFDLDDTLLNSAKEIGPRTRGALDEWLAKGRRICFATSRPIRKVREFLPEELFSSCEIITMNGVVRHSGGLLTYKAGGMGDAARSIVNRFPPGHDIHVTVEIDGEDFAANYESSDEDLMHWNAATRDMVIPLEEVNYERVGKIVLSRWGAQMADLLPWLHDFDYDLMMTEGGSFITVLNRGMDKDVTLAKWLGDEGLGRGDFAVFGDDLPDVRMMKLSDHAVAMSNAISEVKAVAHDIIGHCDDDCIGPYIKRWF